MSRTHDDIHDELLVLQCQEGDRAALEALIARWQPRLARLAWRLTSEREAARDIVQEAWLSIVRGLRRLDDPARFRIWAYRIVSNKCVDWTRRRTVQRNAARDMRNRAFPAAATGPLEDDVDGDVELLREALSELPEDQRAVLSLHYLDGMGVSEIARALNVPQGTVKSRLHYARNRLRQAIERVES